jgi:hypothetical protein
MIISRNIMELIKKEFADIYGGRKKVRLNKKEKELLKLFETELTKKIIGGVEENESKDIEIDKQLINKYDMTTEDLKDMSVKDKQDLLLSYRLYEADNIRIDMEINNDLSSYLYSYLPIG